MEAGGSVKSGGQESNSEEGEANSNLLFANWILVLQIKECGRTDGKTSDVGFLCSRPAAAACSEKSGRQAGNGEEEGVIELAPNSLTLGGVVQPLPFVARSFY